jgi:hypothetical protein
METVESSMSVLIVSIVALLLVYAGLVKKQLVWNAKPLRARRRR